MTLLDDLNDTADILGWLDALVTTPPVQRGGPRIGSSGHSAAHIPINAHALDTIRRLEHALRNATLHVLECAHPSFGRPTAPGPYAQAMWLATVYQKQPTALDDIAEALADEYATARAVINGPADEQPTVDPAEERRAALKLVTAAEAEQITAATGERVKATTVRAWASLGKIPKIEICGQVRYRLAAIVAQAAARDRAA